jgi:hypothetical protein
MLKLVDRHHEGNWNVRHRIGNNTPKNDLESWNEGSTMMEATTGERKDIFTIWKNLAGAAPRCLANLPVCQ